MKKAIKNDENVPSGDGVKVWGDHIYFYGDVNEKSCMDLNIALQHLSIELSTNMLSTMHEVNPPQPIWLHINTFGGNLMDGFAVSDTINRIKEMVPVVTIVEGCSMSAGSIISTSGSKRLMRGKAVMLIHQLSGGMWGKYEDMKQDVKNMDLLMKIMSDHYLSTTKITKEKLEEMLKKDIFLDAKTCLKLGLIDQII
jgi:ATP-dependent Clp endopeptidase proteolytic subunit ClpP